MLRFFQRPVYNQEPSLLKLPQELLLYILSYLPQEDLLSTSLVCQLLGMLSEENNLWEAFLPSSNAIRIDGDLKRSIQILQHIEKHGNEYRYSSWAKAAFKIPGAYTLPLVSSLFVDTSTVDINNEHLLSRFKRGIKVISPETPSIVVNTSIDEAMKKNFSVLGL